MTKRNQLESAGHKLTDSIQIIRHARVCDKLQVSSAKLFDMVAKGQFPKPFKLIPGGRAVGWVETDVDNWIKSRKQACEEALP